jgi:hypothetical protein
MKSLLALAISATLIFSVVNALAGEKSYVATDNEELYGTWVNTNYSAEKGWTHTLHTQRIVFSDDWTFERFTWADRDVSEWKDWYKITDKWIDSEGNVWYRVHWQYFYWEHYGLFKISDSGKKCEFVTDPIEYGYPKKIDPKTISYRIYYRK